MAAENFKETIFEVVEYLTEHRLSNSGRQLVRNYFNDARFDSAYERALFAVLKYFPDSIPPAEERDEDLVELLAKLYRDAREWERE